MGGEDCMEPFGTSIDAWSTTTGGKPHPIEVRVGPDNIGARDHLNLVIAPEELLHGESHLLLCSGMRCPHRERCDRGQHRNEPRSPHISPSWTDRTPRYFTTAE